MAVWWCGDGIGSMMPVREGMGWPSAQRWAIDSLGISIGWPSGGLQLYAYAYAYYV